MPRVSDEHREARRRQILAGARRAFARDGYEAATVPVLERETGLSRGAIFSYFRSKLDLFLALAEDDRRRLLELWTTKGHDGVLSFLVEQEPDWGAVYLDVSRMLRNDRGLRERWEAMHPEANAALERRYRELQDAEVIRRDIPLETIGRFLGLLFDGLAVQQGAGFGDRVDLAGTLELVRSALAPK